MSKFLALIFTATCSFVSAETVLWKATGSVTTLAPVFQDPQIQIGDDLHIRITYNDQSTLTATKSTVIGNFRSTEFTFQTALALKVTIIVGPYTWEGSIQDGSDSSPYSLFVKEASSSTSESFKLNLRSNKGAQFDSFPFQQETGDHGIAIDFLSSSSDFMTGGISTTSFNPNFITSASGSIETGSPSNTLTFTLNPTSVKILNEVDEVAPLMAPIVTASVSDSSFILAWQSDFDFLYRIDSSTNLTFSDWLEVETRFGTDAIITRTYPLTNSPLFYRVVALERPPPE